MSQSVLLFGSENWVLTPRMYRALDSFQNRSTRKITRKQPRRRRTDGSWEYPPLEETLREAGFEGIRKSVTRRQNTVAQYIVTRPILDLCDRSTRRPGERVPWRWWEQDGIYLEGAKKRAAETTTVSESESDSEEESDVKANEDSGREEKS